MPAKQGAKSLLCQILDQGSRDKHGALCGGAVKRWAGGGRQEVRKTARRLSQLFGVKDSTVNMASKEEAHQREFPKGGLRKCCSGLECW